MNNPSKTLASAGAAVGSRDLLGEIIPLIKRYRDNRNLQATKPWDKDADLRAIGDAWLRGHRKIGARFEASAGRFWFTTCENAVIEVDADRYWQPRWYRSPNAGVEPPCPDKQ